MLRVLIKRLFSAQPRLKNESICAQFPTARLITLEGKLSDQPQSTQSLYSSRPPNYDLILVDGSQQPPIVRFAKPSESFKSALKRQEAEIKARLANKVKELHVTTVTGEHDFGVKCDRLLEWLGKGWRVRIVIEEKRRMKPSTSLQQRAVDERRMMMSKITEKTAEVGEVLGPVEVERGNLCFTMGPNAKTLSILKQKSSIKK